MATASWNRPLIYVEKFKCKPKVTKLKRYCTKCGKWKIIDFFFYKKHRRRKRDYYDTCETCDGLHGIFK